MSKTKLLCETRTGYRCPFSGRAAQLLEDIFIRPHKKNILASWVPFFPRRDGGCSILGEYHCSWVVQLNLFLEHLIIYTIYYNPYARSRDKFNKRHSSILNPCFEAGRLEWVFLSQKKVVTCSVISGFQFLQVILKGCVFTLVQNGNIGLKYQKISKTTPAFPNYISTFLSSMAKGAEEVLAVVMMTTIKMRQSIFRA